MDRRQWMTGATALAVAAGASPARAQNLVKVKAGMVSAIDQIGLPIALERGFFEKHGVDLEIARPYATGIDALNALQAGETQIVQVGVPMIGAVCAAWISWRSPTTAATRRRQAPTRRWR